MRIGLRGAPGRPQLLVGTIPGVPAAEIARNGRTGVAHQAAYKLEALAAGLFLVGVGILRIFRNGW